MKKSTKVILSVSLAMLLVGGGLSATAWLISGGNVGLTITSGNELTHSASDNRRFVTDDVALDDFTAVSVDTDYADVFLIPSSGGYRVEYSVLEQLAKPEIDVENGVLNIVNTPVSKKGDALFSGLDSISNLFNRLGDKAYFRIYYPSGTTLSEVLVETGLGDIDMTDTKLSGALTLRASMGDITLERIVASSAELTADMGDIDCDGITANTMELTADMGEVDMENATLAGLEAKLSMGDMSLSGTLTGYTDVENDMGSVDIELRGNQDDYFIDLDTDMGEVSLNDRKYRIADAGDSNAPNQLTVSGSMGDVEVSFE